MQKLEVSALVTVVAVGAKLKVVRRELTEEATAGPTVEFCSIKPKYYHF